MAVFSYECRPVAPDEVAALPHRGEASIVLGCTADELFDVFEDGALWPRWVPAIRDVAWTTPPPVGVGTRRDITFPGGFRAAEVFTAYERGRRFSFCFSTISKPVLAAFAEDYRVEELPGGRCRLTWRMGMAPRGLTKVTIWPFRPLLDPMLGRLLARLAALVDDRAADRA